MRQIIRKRIDRIFYFTLFASLLGGLSGLVSGILDGENKAYDFILVGIVAGVLIGSCMSYLEEFQWRTLSKKISYWPFTIVRLIANSLLIIFWLVVVLAVDHMINDGMGFMQGVQTYIQEENIPRDICLASLVSIIVTEGRKISRLHTVSEWKSLFTGRYFYPEEEERVVLFADLVGSTTLAESMGPMKYSRLISSVFREVSEAILLWQGEVYQHVGDGVVVTWKSEDTKQARFSIECYIAMTDLLLDKSDYYMENYGVLPVLRCGIHRGPLIRTWVGESKRELAFHGDAINTAARIQSACKKFDEACLVSKNVVNELAHREEFKAQVIGKVELKGKKENIEIWAIKKRAT